MGNSKIQTTFTSTYPEGSRMKTFLMCVIVILLGILINGVVFLQNKNHEQFETLQFAMDQITTSQDQVAFYAEYNKELEDLYQRSYKVLLETSKQIKDLVDENSALSAENDKITEAVKTLFKKLVQVQGANDQLQDKIDQLTKTNEQLQKDNDQLQKDKEQLQDENDVLQQYISQLCVPCCDNNKDDQVKPLPPGGPQ